jgi:hypothetical protein
MRGRRDRGLEVDALADSTQLSPDEALAAQTANHPIRLDTGDRVPVPLGGETAKKGLFRCKTRKREDPEVAKATKAAFLSRRSPIDKT